MSSTPLSAAATIATRKRLIYHRARETLEFLELDRLATEKAGTLSGGQKKLLELGRALMGKPRIILLDEIGAGINRTLLGTHCREDRKRSTSSAA